MRTLIENYQNLPGAHCGSTALRNLVQHCCDTHLSEAQIIGLGSGADFLFIQSDANDPQTLALGRSQTMEMDFAQATGIDYRETPEPDNDKAWQLVREQVLAGNPVVLTGDTYYLDYGGFGREHFPSHRFVLLGFDDARQKAIIADRRRSELEESDYNALAASRNPPMPTTTYNLWGRIGDTQVKRSMTEACRIALKRSVDRMLGRDPAPAKMLQALARGKASQIATGLDAIKVFADNFPEWQHRADSQKQLIYTANCLEKFGTGGGNFRLLYAEFLQWAQELLPEIIDPGLVTSMKTCGHNWQTLSRDMLKLSEHESPSAWERCQDQIRQLLDQENQFYKTLDQRLQ